MMTETAKELQLLSLAEVARIMRRSIRTIYRWIDEGKLRTFQTHPGAHHQVSVEELLDFVRRSKKVT